MTKSAHTPDVLSRVLDGYETEQMLASDTHRGRSLVGVTTFHTKAPATVTYIVRRLARTGLRYP
jgi:hypothetical protein